MKDVWSGSIAFGLVNIPIRLYPAVKSHSQGFRLLEKETKSPIEYKRWCPSCGKEVAWKDVVKGLEIKKNEYLVLTKEELEKLRPQKTESIEIVEFVDWPLDPIYLNNHYYVAPENTKEKAYFLFKEVLMLSAKAAIGRFVMREKEHVCAITSYKNGLILTTLNYSYEIRDMDEIQELKEPVKLKKEEVDLAKQIIDKLYNKRLDISKYKDTFAEELRKALKNREKGVVVTVSESREAPKESNLVEALKQSLKK